MNQSTPDIRNRLLLARLPAMPQILIKLIEHLQADDAGLPELAALISRDAAMSSKILGVANSSAYHRNGRAFGLQQALVTLGTDMLKTLLISESVFRTFNSFPHSATTDLRSFWKNSLTTAVIARDIARKVNYPLSEEAYLAGLLHNVGRLALLAAAPRQYALNFMARDDASLCAVEQRTLQITHAEAGAWLIERWQLDSFLADSVLYHHEPSARLAACHPLIRIVRLAHLLASGHDELPALAEMAALCAIESGDLDRIALAAARQVKQNAAHLGIDIAGADDIVAAPALAPDDPLQQRLSEEMRHMLLVSEMGQTFARQQGEAELLESMARSARILFDFDNVAILLENPTGHALVGVACGLQQHRLAEFSIPLNDAGPVARSARMRRQSIVVRDGQALGIAEDQLFRMMGSECLVCLPLVVDQRCLGLLIGGAAGWQTGAHERRARFLQSFGRQAASALEAAISARGQAQRQVLHVAEEYHTASRSLAHEVNNPLAIIKNYLGVLDAKLARCEPVAGEISILNEEIDRVGQLINGLANLQPSATNSASRTGDVGRVVGEVLQLFRASDFVPATVQIVAHLQHGPAEIDGAADILKQILVNLVKNAVEALPDGGKIEISQRGHVNRARRLYLELCVSDNGPGLSPEVLAQLFSAVRSSKDGAHHGLGLAIVHGLVTQLNGLIACRSNSGGTTFEILLPVRASASEDCSVPAPQPDSDQGIQ